MEIVREGWPILLVFGIVAVFAVHTVLSRLRGARARAVALKQLELEYGLRDPHRWARFFQLPQLEGEIRGLHVRVIFFRTSAYEVTTFHVQVRVPALGYAIVEPRSSVGQKGPITALRERAYLGAGEVYLNHPEMHRTFRVRGREPHQLQALLSSPLAASAMLKFNEAMPNASIEWGLLRYYVDALMNDASQIGRVLEGGVAIASALEQAAQLLPAPSVWGPSPHGAGAESRRG